MQRTLPFFDDPRIGMVQARWSYLNRAYALLTLAQALGIDGHFWVEQTARHGAGWFMNFNSFGGIWRRFEGVTDTWGGEQYPATFPRSSLPELLLMLYSAYGVGLAWASGVYGVLPAQCLYTLGFAMVAGLSLWEVCAALSDVAKPARRVPWGVP